MMLVTLDEYMGTDATVARRAWVSTQKETREATPERVEGLIKFLLSNSPTHASPFGHPHITFLIECPIFVAREWMRHRAQTFSEVSSRYSEFDGACYLPPLEDFRVQVGKPGEYYFESMEYLAAATAQDVMEMSYDASVAAYRKLLEQGVAKEVARNVLPVGTMTRFYATASLRNWMGFLLLRNHPSALLEIRQCAVDVEQILTTLFPITMRVWNENNRPSL